MSGLPEAPLLEVRGLHTELAGPDGLLPVVRDVDLSVPYRGSLGIVGESGSGKSMLAKSLMNLLPARAVSASRSMTYDGRPFDPRRPSSRAMWGAEIAMVFQDPLTAMNPVRTVGAQIGDTLRVHDGLSRRQARRVAVDLLGQVGIPSPGLRVSQYPHELSGGMRQRAMIAMAIACRPRLLIADEPTTGLDVTVQRQILTLLRRLREEHDMALVLISHDLGMVADEVEQVSVMYAGELVEGLSADALRRHEARHPYARALLAAHPDVNAPIGQRLEAIPGRPPSPGQPVAGCRFAPRCAHARDLCRAEAPAAELDGPRLVRCHFPVLTATPNEAQHVR